MTPPPSSSSPTPSTLLTRNEILDAAKKLAKHHNWSIKLALAVIQCRLDTDRRFYESDLAYSLLDEITKGQKQQQQEDPSLLFKSWEKEEEEKKERKR